MAPGPATPPGPMLKKILDGYYRLLQVLLTVLMTALLVPVTLQILSRYTGLIPRYIWTEEIARFCFVWIIMIGAMIAVRDGTHFDVDVLPRLSAKVEAGLRLFVHFAMLLASLIFVTYGYQFAKFGSIQQSEISGLPMLTIYIAWPLAGLTWLAFLGEKFREDFRIFRGEMPPPEHEIVKVE
jgi:TRAP-type C4-dicarboxylate transport system permease small subunit